MSEDMAPFSYYITTGPPLPPTNITFTANGVNSITIRWTSSSVRGVSTTFNLRITNPSTGPVLIGDIQTNHYVFSVNGTPSCDSYGFQVTAVNDAGTSNPSQMVTRSLPSLPDVSSVSGSLRHSLGLNSSGVVLLSVTFDVSVTCNSEAPN